MESTSELTNAEDLCFINQTQTKKPCLLGPENSTHNGEKSGHLSLPLPDSSMTSPQQESAQLGMDQNNNPILTRDNAEPSAQIDQDHQPHKNEQQNSQNIDSLTPYSKPEPQQQCNLTKATFLTSI
ncbi:hypothetical protein C2G38_2036561 [Gigaspora rosea]|uniref:Uncharacterized protein n=1 Tax=Gigaspora rosea TaxID=44941 RepID=A0A397V8I3_9GLOM|nr:hypothetical protein C2G38_2036561 [Gigaspora rosea]